MKIINGILTKVFEKGSLCCPATLNLSTYEVTMDKESNPTDMGCLLSERFQSKGSRSAYIICPQCHQYVLRDINVKTDEEGRIIQQEPECPQCEKF